MALRRDYHYSHLSASTMPSSRPSKRPSSPASASSSSHESPPHQETRRRRGRQARPSQLSPRMRKAAQKFSRAVGNPQVVEPAGFRDFRGWLARLSSRQCRPLWDELLAVVARDVDCDVQAVHALKEDIVREIIKCVVVPRPDESAKLVSTNAGRQASRPRSGTTLMVVLEEQLDRVDNRLPELVSQLAASSSSSEAISEERQHHRGSSSSSRRSDRREGKLPLPSVSDILGDRERERDRDSLPSFQELDASLQKRRRGHGHGHSSSHGHGHHRR